MPGFDGTGPMGRGAATGGGYGSCRGGGYGRGFGWGPGRGPGAHWYGRPAPYYGPAVRPHPEDEKVLLQEQSEQLKAELEQIRERMNELEQQ